MKRKRYTLEQIIRKLREADRLLSEGKYIALVCQALEVSEATFHRCRTRTGGIDSLNGDWTDVRIAQKR